MKYFKPVDKPAGPVRLAIVTNIPAPYRVPVYNRVAACGDVVFRAFYGSASEANRRWDLPAFAHDHEFLNGKVYERAGRYIHSSPDVMPGLARFRPDVVVTTGFNPLHLAAFAYTVLNRCCHVPMTDGTEASEAGLSLAHRWVRRAVFAGSQSFVAASEGGRRLFRSYGVDDARIHFSPLCANLSVPWLAPDAAHRDIDLLFSGRLVAAKRPAFALDVAAKVAQSLGRRVRIALLGDGPLEASLSELANRHKGLVDVMLMGHVAQSDIPGWMARARLLLFPTEADVWGVVANEACHAGVPVLVSPHAGVAQTLVRDGVNGHVLPLDLDVWTGAVARLLSDAALHQRMSAAALLSVAPYSFENAAAGILDATHQAAACTATAATARSTFPRRQRVVCVQRRLPHYRVELFNALKRELAERNIDFALVHGNGTTSEQTKADGGSLDWAQTVPCTYLLGGRLCWQNPGRQLRSADLVILTQENKLIYNLRALLWPRPWRLAFWGHGRNMQSNNAGSWRERFKRWTTRKVDWWFAYTALSARTVQSDGFAPRRISDLQNAIDTQALVGQCRAVTAADIQALRQQLALGVGPVGVFVGSLYADKRLDFLLDAGARLAQQLPDFRLLVVGDGPQRPWLDHAAGSRPWLRVMGPRQGHAKAVCLRCATLMLNPGLVGLGILDAFAAGLPLLTTDFGKHSPEIEYLRHGENGVVTANTVDAFAQACAGLLCDPALRQRLAEAAFADAAHYTLSNMVTNFSQGIEAALAISRRAGGDRSSKAPW